MATPHAVLTHVHPPIDAPRRDRHPHRLRNGLLVGATAALSLTVLPATASAAPDAGSTPQQAAQHVADASHQLEIVTERVNTARVLLDQQKAAVAKADLQVAAAQRKLDAMAGQIRQLARSAYTGGGPDVSQLNVLMTSSSADQFVSQLGTLDAIAGHTNNVVVDITRVSKAASAARAQAAAAAARAQRTLAQITAQQKVLQTKIAEYRQQYAALTAPQRAIVASSSGAVAAPRTLYSAGVGAASGNARTAVSTALAQVGKPYVWGAAGPNSFDCSGLMQYAWAAAGVALPHSSSAQSTMGTPVSRSQLQPGDLVFFYSPVSHVGMYIGNGQMVHAATSGEPVQVVSLDSMPDYNSARRVG